MGGVRLGKAWQVRPVEVRYGVAHDIWIWRKTMKTSEIKANRQLWYDELMSGKHEQTISALQDKGGKCCLGVACHIAVREGIIDEPEIDMLSYETASFDGHNATLPPSVMEWLGFDTVDPVTSKEMSRALTNYYPTFSELNDNEKMNFEEIAAILKRDFIDPLEGQDDDTST